MQYYVRSTDFDEQLVIRFLQPRISGGRRVLPCLRDKPLT